MKASIKTIDVTAKEWFDKVNGNSYFSAVATINQGLTSELVIELPFQYGYGDHYQDMAFQAIQKRVNKKVLKNLHKMDSLSRFCNDNKIILRTRKIENCLKREL